MAELRRSSRNIGKVIYIPETLMKKERKNPAFQYDIMTLPETDIVHTIQKSRYASPPAKTRKIPYQEMGNLRFGEPDFMRCSYALIARLFKDRACVVVPPHHIGRQEHVSIYWNVTREGSNFIPKLLPLIPDLKKYIESCCHKGRKFIVLPLYLNHAAGGHANVIMVDCERKRATRYDPHGEKTLSIFVPERLDRLLKVFFDKMGIQYDFAGGLYYHGITNFQQLECDEESVKCPNDPEGWCSIWTIFYVYMRLLYNDLNEPEFVHKISKEISNMKKGKKSDTFTRFIRNWAHKLRNEMVESKLCEGANIEDVFDQENILQPVWNI